MVAQKRNDEAPSMSGGITTLDRSDSTWSSALSIKVNYINCNKPTNPEVSYSSPVCLGRLQHGYSNEVDELNVVWLLLVHQAVINVSQD